MPNHVTNIITADPDTMDLIRATLKGPSDAVDFEMLIPMPAHLKDEKGDVLQPSMDVITRAKAAMGLMPNGLPSYMHDRALRDGDAEMIAGCLNAHAVTGYFYWYDWAVKHWGTKWNAYSIKADDPAYLAFETAWSTPSPIWAELHNRIRRKWTLRYADEDIGANCGKIEFSPDGAPEVTTFDENYSDASKAFARSVKEAVDPEYFAGYEEDED